MTVNLTHCRVVSGDRLDLYRHAVQFHPTLPAVYLHRPKRRLMAELHNNTNSGTLLPGQNYICKCL